MFSSCQFVSYVVEGKADKDQSNLIRLQTENRFRKAKWLWGKQWDTILLLDKHTTYFLKCKT